MRAQGDHLRRIRDWLVEYGAENVHYEGTSGKHPRLCFRFNGQEHRRVVGRSPTDRHALENDFAEFRRMLGPQIRQVASPKRNIEEMMSQTQKVVDANGIAHPSSETAQLAVRTVQGIRDLARQPEPPLVFAADNQQPIIQSASDVSIHLDRDEACDLIFSATYKTVAKDRKIIRHSRLVTAVSLPITTILSLWDALEPIIKKARPEPEPEQVLVEQAPPPAPAEPEKPKRHKTPPGSMPHGLDVVLMLAEKLATARRRIAEETGSERSILYNKAIATFYQDNPELAILTGTMRSYLNALGREAEKIREWGRTYLTPTLRAEITISGLSDRWQERKEKVAREEAAKSRADADKKPTVRKRVAVGERVLEPAEADD